MSQATKHDSIFPQLTHPTVLLHQEFVNRQAVGKDLSAIQIKTSIGTIDAGETDFQSQRWHQGIRESDEDRVEFRHSGLDGDDWGGEERNHAPIWLSIAIAVRGFPDDEYESFIIMRCDAAIRLQLLVKVSWRYPRYN